MDKLTEFLSQGNYMGFVWASYGVTALILIALIATSLRTLRANQAALAALQAAGGDRRHARDDEARDEA